MQNDPTPETPTLLIQAAAGGDTEARDRVFQVLRTEIHEIAEALTRKQDRQVTYEAGVLVNELWMKVRSAFPEHGGTASSSTAGTFGDRQAFLRYATTAMKRMLVDGARRRIAARRGGNHRILSLADEVLCDEPLHDQSTPEALLFAAEMAESLQKDHPEHARLFEFVRFGGLHPTEAGSSLGMSESKTNVAWTLVRGLVMREWSQPG